MTTITQNVGRGDILLHRGVSERVGVQWTQDAGDGQGYRPVDMDGWTGVFRMTGPLGDVWFETDDVRLDSRGVAAVMLAPGTFDGDEWAGRTDGEWRLTARNPLSGGVELLGWGHYHLEL